MAKYVINGGNQLQGSVTINGAKNAAVAILPAALLVAGKCRVENVPDIYVNRLQVFSEIEEIPDFLSDRVYTAEDGELWTLRKVLRRFLWHDRIHAKAMWRTATALWGDEIKNPFCFV